MEAFRLAPYPATEVSWIEAAQFCNLLSEETGLEACYSIGDYPDAHDVIRHREADGSRVIQPFRIDAIGFRLGRSL